MSPEELKQLQKAVKRNKRLAGEQAMELHDLVEDRLPGAYQELMSVAQTTYEACAAWDEAVQRLTAAENAST